jgi:hypothetical protein
MYIFPLGLTEKDLWVPNVLPSHPFKLVLHNK